MGAVLYRHNTCMFISYLRREDAIFTILCAGLPITTTVAVEWLNNLIFHDNIKCITANVEANYICHMMVIPFVKKFWEV